jgi:tRNA1Val (adenine37-N6)-methyltransferase
MPNTYFQFKEFTVHQEKCAMKICTDACLFGAYVTETIMNENLPIKNCLDIGSGTGLLSLIMAQKVKCNIDAVEIDKAAYEQAGNNFAQSPWKERLAVFNTDIAQFDTTKKYDCIISNPPFFEGDLKSENSNKNAAKHDTALTLQQLLLVVVKHLNDDGFFAVLLPYPRVSYCIGQAEKIGLHCSKKILVKQTPKHNYFRGVLFFSRKTTALNTEEIIITNEKGAYTEVFSRLVKDYYLYL